MKSTLHPPPIRQIFPCVSPESTTWPWKLNRLAHPQSIKDALRATYILGTGKYTNPDTEHFTNQAIQATLFFMKS